MPDYCTEIDNMNQTDPITEFKVQVVGDSLFGADADGCASVSTFMSLRLWLEVEDNSIPGAIVSDGDEGIPQQYVSGDWNWTVINGGANDIMPYCTENDCDEVLDEIITDSGEGQIPNLVEKAQNDGSNVILIGYYSVPKGSEYEPVILEVEIINDRYNEFAKANEGVYFISLKDVMNPEETPELYSEDLVHPSNDGHFAIGEHIADFIIDEHKKETGMWFR
jgi:lysophospholipase L1-like esterase